MPVVCYKPFQIKVDCSNPWTEVLRYYTMEETGNNPRVDKVAGNVLIHEGPLLIDSKPGLYGNSVHFYSFNPGGISGGTLHNSPYVNLPTNNVGFSVAGWFNILHLTPDYSSVGFGFRDSVSSDMAQAALSFGTGTASALQIIDRGGQYFNTPVSAPFPIGEWAFFHMFWDVCSKQAGYSINDGPEVLSGSNLVLGSFDEYWLEFADWSYAPEVPTEILYDEVIVSLGGKLKPTHLSYLYNSGAGRTWPITLP